MNPRECAEHDAQIRAERESTKSQYVSVDLDLLAQLVTAARDLKSVSGENVEYDNALVQLTTTVLGLDYDDRGSIADLIGIPNFKF